MALKNVIFDFGGVLIDWNPHHLYDKVFGSPERADWFLANVCTADWNVRCDAGWPFREAIAERTAKFPAYAEEIRMYRSRWTEMIGGPVPGMYEYLKSLKEEGYRLFGLSNWARETFDLVRDEYPALGLLEDYVISGDEGVVKPDPRIFRILLDRCSLRPEECAFVDDNPPNVAAAGALGMSGILFVSRQDLAVRLRDVAAALR